MANQEAGSVHGARCSSNIKDDYVSMQSDNNSYVPPFIICYYKYLEEHFHQTHGTVRCPICPKVIPMKSLLPLHLAKKHVKILDPEMNKLSEDLYRYIKDKGITSIDVIKFVCIIVLFFIF